MTAAINLAKHDYQVDIYEQASDVGVRFHGDFQGLENWTEKEDVLEFLKKASIYHRFYHKPVSDLMLTNSQFWNRLSGSGVLVYLVKRGNFLGSLDYSLKEQALDLGVNIHFNQSLALNKADIIATGPNLSHVFGLAKGITFQTDSKDKSVVIFNDRFAPGGYGYLHIADHYGCLCVAAIKDIKEINISDYLQKTKSFFIKKFDLKLRSVRRFSGIASFLINPKLQEGRKLFVGEAAGLQDFFWGFGIRYAIGSGYLAAKSIIENSDYKALIKRHLDGKIKASLVNRYLWGKFGSYDYVFPIRKAKLMRRLILSMSNFNWLQKFIYPFVQSYARNNYPDIF